jgi:hypothetical protein
VMFAILFTRLELGTKLLVALLVPSLGVFGSGT